jgi:hypothetical protein
MTNTFNLIGLCFSFKINKINSLFKFQISTPFVWHVFTKKSFKISNQKLKIPNYLSKSSNCTEILCRHYSDCKGRIPYHIEDVDIGLKTIKLQQQKLHNVSQFFMCNGKEIKGRIKKERLSGVPQHSTSCTKARETNCWH